MFSILSFIVLWQYHLTVVRSVEVNDSSDEAREVRDVFNLVNFTQISLEAGMIFSPGNGRSTRINKTVAVSAARIQTDEGADYTDSPRQCISLCPHSSPQQRNQYSYFSPPLPLSLLDYAIKYERCRILLSTFMSCH